MTLDQCWEVARRWYRGRMDPGWRGLAPAAAQGVFEAAGLEGPFWSLT